VSDIAGELPPDFELVIRPHSAISIYDVADVWRYRELLWTLAMRDVRVRYKQAAFGVAWALLQPVVQMLIYTLLFNRLAGIHADLPVPYRVFVFSGIVVWTWFSNGLAQASDSLVANANVITKIYFPRVVVPLATILAAGADFLIGFVLVLLLTVASGVALHVSVLLCLPLGIAAAACALAVGLWTSAINLQFRDVRYALPFVLQILIFITPVFYPASLVPARYRPLLLVNPMAAIVDGFRAALVGAPLPWLGLGVAAAIILLVGTTGFLYFRRMEQTFADRA
jgi:lipopolysaccharide transport system permease protein